MINRNYPISSHYFPKLIENDAIYVDKTEFKINRKPAVALQQMKDKNYAAHYSLSKKQIVLIGVCFTMQKRGISGHAVEAI